MTGAFRSMFNITTGLSEEYEFYYALPKTSSLIDFLKSHNRNAIPIGFLEVQKNFRVLFYFPVLLYNSIILLRKIHHYKIEIIHSNDLYNMCGVVCKLLNPKIRLVYFVRLLPNSYIRLLYRHFAFVVSKVADKVCAISDAVKNGLDKLNVKSEVIHCHFIQPEKYPAKSNFHSQAPVLLYLSNFMSGKGQDFAMRAFEIAKKKRPDLKMIMAGGTLGLEKNKMMRQKLEESAIKSGLRDDVMFLDFIHDVEKLMKDSDVFLNFSESESFSMTCLEALNYGLPLIATDCGGPAELFENGKSGILVPNKDVNAMAEAILKVAADETLRKQLSEEGRKYSMSKFNEERSLKEMRLVYQQLVQ